MTPTDAGFVALLVFPALVGVYDLFLCAARRPTISARVRGLATRYPVLPAGVGLIYGYLIAHLFGPMIAPAPLPPIRTFAAMPAPGDYDGRRYVAEYVENYDGDTVTLRRVEPTFKVRLADVDTPEIRSNAHNKADPAARAARDYLRGMLAGKRVFVSERGTRTFDRAVADLAVEGPGGALIDVAATLVQSGHAKVWTP